ncbi:ATP-binding cassette domain-containing protein, partial [Streptobacillus moniliformis]
ATGGYEIEFKIKQVMQGLELNNFRDINISSLSGGEKTRVTLAKLLLQEPDLLILDEPTNHLDIVSIEWLEEYLKKYT